MKSNGIENKIHIIDIVCRLRQKVKDDIKKWSPKFQEING